MKWQKLEGNIPISFSFYFPLLRCASAILRQTQASVVGKCIRLPMSVTDLSLPCCMPITLAKQCVINRNMDNDTNRQRRSGGFGFPLNPLALFPHIITETHCNWLNTSFICVLCQWEKLEGSHLSVSRYVYSDILRWLEWVFFPILTLLLLCGPVQILHTV